MSGGLRGGDFVRRLAAAFSTHRWLAFALVVVLPSVVLSIVSLRLIDRQAQYKLAELLRASEGTPWYYEERMNRVLEARAVHAARVVGHEALKDPVQTQQRLRAAGLALFDVMTLDPPGLATPASGVPLALSSEMALVLDDGAGHPLGTLRYRYSDEGIKIVLRESLREQGAPWNDDSVQIFLGGRTSGHFRDGFDLNLNVRVDDAVASERQGRAGDVRFASQRTADGFSVEVAIAWRQIGVEPVPGAEFRFDLANNDRDTRQELRNGQLTWAGSDRNWADPSGFGIVRLALQPEESGVGRAVALPVRHPVVIDGKLSEADWALTNQVTKREGRTDNVVHWGLLWSPEELLIGVHVRDADVLNNWSREQVDWVLRIVDPEGRPILDSAADASFVLRDPAAVDVRQVIALGPLRGSQVLFGYRHPPAVRIVRRWKLGALALIVGANAMLAAGLWLVFASVRREIHLAALKSHFVATVSHEFKAPLALLQVSAETLRGDRVLDEATRRQYQEIIETESGRLASLVDTVLAVSRIEAGRPYRFAPTRVADVVQGALRLHQLKLEREGFEVAVSVPNDLPTIEADAGAVQEALSNLIDNAIKYSRERKSCRIAARAVGDSVEISVSDDGLGIPVADQEKIFERFYRGENEGHGEKGVGLGLSISQAIARAHGGDMRAESAPGGGSTITLVLSRKERAR